MMQIDDEAIIEFFVDKNRNRIYEARLNPKFLDKYPQYKEYLDHRYEDEFEKYAEVITRIYHKIDIKPVCRYCGKQLKFKSFKQPYGIWCNQQCQLRDPQFIQERTQNIDYDKMLENLHKTCLEKYGVENPIVLKSTQAKSRATKLEKYGNPTYTNKEKTKQTCLERYGVENSLQSEGVRSKATTTKLKKYGNPTYTNREKAKQTCLERYGMENYMETDEFKDKSKEVLLEKYGFEHASQAPEIRNKIDQTNIERYGTINPMQNKNISSKVSAKFKTGEPQQKIYTTKKLHHTFNTSIIEQQFKKWLEDNNINFIYQHKSEDYPFCCDFYFPEYDLYFEIQGNWTHGDHPFDKNSRKDMDIINKWKSKNTKFYDNAIHNWTISDVKKRSYATEHELNYVEVFSIKLKDVINAYESAINNIR